MTEITSSAKQLAYEILNYYPDMLTEEDVKRVIEALCDSDEEELTRILYWCHDEDSKT